MGVDATNALGGPARLFHVVQAPHRTYTLELALPSAGSGMADGELPLARIERNMELLRAAENGDAQKCLMLLSKSENGDKSWDGSADTWFADANTLGWDALHFAADGGHVDIVHILLQHGALWNAVDELGYTAADVAWSKNHSACYQELFEEGVRQSFLVSALSRRTHEVKAYPEANASDHAVTTDGDQGTDVTLVSGTNNEVTYSNEAFLDSRLSFSQDEQGQWRCLDKDNNMVMAEWENDIMLASAHALCENQPEGFSVLNVGFGLGIVDEAIQAHKPGRHVIIEPHPDVLAFMEARGWHEKPGVEIFRGTWEQFMKPENDENGEIVMALGDFDAVYFDTYSQDYQDLRDFFECLPNVLSGPDARFSFCKSGRPHPVHGLAATNLFLYNVYTRVAELDLRDIGLSTSWTTLPMHVKEEIWKGVKRKYWTLDRYYLPVCQMELI